MAAEPLSEEVKSVRSESPDHRRQRLYRRAILVALVGNLGLAIAKGGAAWISGSSAVLSDAANSLSDTLYSLFMALGLYLARQPADRSHPQGHSRFEPLVSLLIAAVMGVAGYAAIREAIQRFRSGATAIPLGWSVAALLGSILVKVVMYRLVLDAAQKANSPAIRASARDNLADVATSSAALLGVLGSNFVHPLLDPLAGVLVALWILRAIWEIAHENLGYLTGRGAPPEVTAEIVEAASSVSGVLDVHQVIADHVGPELRIDMHIDVDGDLTLHEAHAIGEQVETRVEALPKVDQAFVHVEPDRRQAREHSGSSRPR
jgi:cation diffusion facilitator family transporter